MIRFACPQCHKKFQVDDKLAGKRTKCPGCSEPLSIPSEPVLVSSKVPGTTASPKNPEVAANKPAKLSSPVAGNTRAQSGGRPIQDQSPTRKSLTDVESSGLSTAAKLAFGIGGAFVLLIVSVLVWQAFTLLGGDTWERNNSARISTTIEEANRQRQSEPLRAYLTLGDAIEEAKQHKVTDERLLTALADAEKYRKDIYPKIEVEIRAAETEKQRIAQEKANSDALEQQRLAEEKEQKRLAEEAQKREAAKQQATDKRLKEAASRYRNPPQGSRAALNVLKKLQARTEVGINYQDYSKIVGEAWAEIKVFSESPEGKSVPEFSTLLMASIAKYRLALEIWSRKIGGDEKLRLHAEASDMFLQEFWRAASSRINVAESLLSPDSVEQGLDKFLLLESSEQVYDESMRSLFAGLTVLKLKNDLLDLSPENEQYRADFNASFRQLAEVLDKLRQLDMQGQ